MNSLKDNYQRTIDYLRISITDRCNLRCIYCMPSEGVIPIEHKEILRFEEIVRIAKIASGIGVRKIRITGGEPLVRKNVTYLIKEIKSIEGIEDLSLTTNGVLLLKYAEELAEAGLDRINISLDSCRPERYKEITRGGDISVVMSGIAAAEMAGLKPIKVNMVPIRDFNDNEIADLARITLKTPYQVRFIEFMPFGTDNIWGPEKYIPADEIKSIVESIGPLVPVTLRKSGPARYFKFDGAPGVIGFISPISHHFCNDCNRLRLTADGKIRPCLFSETEIDLKPALRGGVPDREIERLIRLSIEVKPEGHNIRVQNLTPGTGIKLREGCRWQMSKIGG
ncbi:MAG: GTP 3',8-cyclase MoaA [Nitrospirota bacterium]|nr:GTP 3',8-cyclase MoaA [Nitrospirota bacterium]MDH5768694.1 GTP 3',8-cyclase MoaA [Nitrospirota bacterium]